MLNSLNEVQLIQEVSKLGIKIKSVSDLLFLKAEDKVVAPVLIKYLMEADDEEDKQFWARCLGLPGLTEASAVLLGEFRRTNSKDYKWVIGNSICMIRDQSILEDLLEIATEPDHGYARQMIVYSLAYYEKEKDKVREVLVGLLRDEEVTGHAIHALGRMKDPALIQYLEPFLQSPKTVFRTAAKKAINKLKKFKPKV